jgi:hypothetical protein
MLDARHRPCNPHDRRDTMAVDVDIDVDLLKNEIKKPYASGCDEPDRDFIFPTGRAWRRISATHRSL